MSVPHEVAEERLQAVLDAGGTLVSDESAPAFWVVADADGNRSCICTWRGRSAWGRGRRGSGRASGPDSKGRARHTLGGWAGRGTRLPLQAGEPAQRAIQALVASRGGAWVFSRVLPTLDTWVERLTRRRHTVPSLLGGLPVVDVTTTGAQERAPRTAHLIGISPLRHLALIGSNFGQASTPTWVLEPRGKSLQPRWPTAASVQDVVARHRRPTLEQTEVLDRSEKIYSGYRKYQTRITGRRLRVFVLERPRRLSHGAATPARRQNVGCRPTIRDGWQTELSADACEGHAVPMRLEILVRTRRVS